MAVLDGGSVTNSKPMYATCKPSHPASKVRVRPQARAHTALRLEGLCQQACREGAAPQHPCLPCRPPSKPKGHTARHQHNMYTELGLVHCHRRNHGPSRLAVCALPVAQAGGSTAGWPQHRVPVGLCEAQEMDPQAARSQRQANRQGQSSMLAACPTATLLLAVSLCSDSLTPMLTFTSGLEAVQLVHWEGLITALEIISYGLLQALNVRWTRLTSQSAWHAITTSCKHRTALTCAGVAPVFCRSSACFAMWGRAALLAWLRCWFGLSSLAFAFPIGGLGGVSCLLTLVWCPWLVAKICISPPNHHHYHLHPSACRYHLPALLPDSLKGCL
ncbi:hypothetical protein V8C86DRAFT_527934 [Haematococcus lacustris]